MKNNRSSEDIIERFAEYVRAMESDKKVLTKLFGELIWFISRTKEDIRNDLSKISHKVCKSCVNSQHDINICAKTISEAVGKASKTISMERFLCYDSFRGFIFPIAQGEKIYGFMALCQIVKEYSQDNADIFAGIAETILKDIQKEMELKKLYDTIRPRAIALSTVHTLHRLISSTLDLNELLPRIARLALQVMRSNRCSIKLVDSTKKVLLPKATIDLRKQKTILKKVQIGRWAPGKAVKYSRSVRGRDFLATPLIDEDVIGVVTVYDKLDKKPFTDFDEEIMKTLCEQAVIAIKNAQLYKEQERLTMGSIKSIAAIMESKAPGTYIPKASFLRIVHLVGVELKLSEYDLKCLQYACMLHDTGQITLPDAITKKSGVLTGAEYDMIKEHPKKAAIILKPLKSLKNVVPIILYHHENYDGSGYPKGLKNNEIPLGARIVAVVGAFEAMITPKAYRAHMTINEAVQEIKNNSGKQFDPKVVQAFLKVIQNKNVLKMLRKEIYGNK